MNAKDFQDLLKESKAIIKEEPTLDKDWSPKKALKDIKAQEEHEELVANKIAAGKRRQEKYDELAQKHDEEFYTRYDKKSLIEIIRKKLEEAGEIIDDPSIIMDKLARFIDDIKTPKSSALRDYQNQERP